MKKMNGYVKLACAFIALTVASCEKEPSPPVNTKASNQENQELKNARKRVAQLERELELAKDMQERQAETISQLQGKIGRFQNALSTASQAIEAQKNLVDAQKNLTEVYRSKMSQPPVQVASSYVPPAPPEQIPWWQAPTPNAAAKIIKEQAVAKWKDDYSMVEYEIQKETGDYEKLKRLNLTYDKATKDIIARAVQKWPNSYTMAVYETERQLDALRNIQKR